MSVEGAAGGRHLLLGPRGLGGSHGDRHGDVDAAIAATLWRARWSAIGIAAGAVLLGPLAPVVWAMVIIDFFHRHADRDARVLLLKQLAGTLVAVPAGVFSFFLVGETLTDPGGVKGVVLVIAWALPAAVLAALIWTWPRPATYVVALMTLGVLVMDCAYASDPRHWRSFEDNHGPVAAASNFVVVVVTVVLAWRRPRVGGALMLVVPIVAIALASFVDELIPAAFAATVVGLVPGFLFVGSTIVGRSLPGEPGQEMTASDDSKRPW